MTEDKDVQELVDKMVKAQAIVAEKQAAEKKAKDKEITGGTVIGAIILGLFTGISIIYGIVLIARGLTNKGLLYIGTGAAWWLLIMALTYSG